MQNYDFWFEKATRGLLLKNSLKTFVSSMKQENWKDFTN